MKTVKSIITFILCICVCNVAYAKRINADIAYQKAMQYNKNYVQSRSVNDAELVYNTDNYYVFNYTNGGFVIVSGSDKTDEILGYSKDGVFDVNNMPEGISNILAGYNEEIDYAESNNITPVRSRTTDEYKEPIEPMIKTLWGQSDPYNRYCPIIDGKFTKVGCVALALAQIMNYHKNDYQPTGLYTSTVRDQTISILLDTCKVNYDNILIAYHGLETDDQLNEVARLVKMCGNLTDTYYRTTVSGVILENILKSFSYLGFTDEVKEIHRDEYNSQTEWDDDIYNSLKNYGPVMYIAYKSIIYGHCFICDGYEDGYFHIVWGSYGSYDGFFKLNALKYKNTDYKYRHSAFININPLYPTRTDKSDETSSFNDKIIDNNDYISIYDLVGKLIYNGSYNNMNNIKPGIYIIKSNKTTNKIYIK